MLCFLILLRLVFWNVRRVKLKDFANRASENPKCTQVAQRKLTVPWRIEAGIGPAWSKQPRAAQKDKRFIAVAVKFKNLKNFLHASFFDLKQASLVGGT